MRSNPRKFMDIDLILALVILIFSVIAHEVAHGYAADALGDPTARLAGRLTLNPLPHIDLVGSVVIPILLVLSHSPVYFGLAKPVPYNPYNLKNQRWGEAMVAVAGSATNIFLALVFALMVRFGAGLPEPAVSVATTIAFINLFLGLFNLLPFPPLDGFTALRAALPWRFASRLLEFEARVRDRGVLALVLFLLVFSYVLAAPFSAFVFWLFTLLVGRV